MLSKASPCNIFALNRVNTVCLKMPGWRRGRVLQKYVRQVQKAIISYLLHICFALSHPCFSGSQEISIREFSPATVCYMVKSTDILKKNMNFE